MKSIEYLYSSPTNILEITKSEVVIGPIIDPILSN